MFLAIGNESPEALAAFRDAFAVEMPILVDEGGKVQALYQQEMAFPTAAYPQQWLIGADGDIVYVNNELEVDGLIAALEAELPSP